MPAKTDRTSPGSAKAALRNFTFSREADAELVRLKAVTGKNMTAVLEDLLLQRRQFSAPVECWLHTESSRARQPRAAIIERVLAMVIKTHLETY